MQNAKHAFLESLQHNSQQGGHSSSVAIIRAVAPRHQVPLVRGVCNAAHSKILTQRCVAQVHCSSAQASDPA